MDIKVQPGTNEWFTLEQSEAGISNTENTKANMNGYLASRGRIGNRLFFAYRRMGNRLKYRVYGAYQNGRRLAEFIAVLRLLVFIYL